MVNPIHIVPPTIVLKAPDKSVHIVNEYEWLYIRVQIKENEEEGWVWLDNTFSNPVPIFSNGEPRTWPSQFDLLDNLVQKLYQ